jgi:outer membrane protein OmpA-like peptidoglycan-associated protein
MKPPVWRVLGGLLMLAAVAACTQAPRKAQPVRAAVPPPATPAPPVCMDMSFPVYFANASQDLTPAAQGVIADAGARLKGCAFKGAEIVGLADATGSSAANLAISRRRAQTVAKAMTAAGLPIPANAVQAFGAAGAVTPSGDPEPLRRRVEVIVRAAPPPAPPAAASAAPAKAR